MAINEITTEELLVLLNDKANAPPSGPNEVLARHLKCKQSRALSEAVASAAHRYIDPANPRLLPPSEMLPPLA
jgi:predicted anti-sigma-YlaC factor YlaD